MPNAVLTDWPAGPVNGGWPIEPTAMMEPGKVEGWPAGTQRTTTAAARLLSQAVGYWDARSFRDGDRFLRNQGTGGDLLDMRLGSAATANSNDPQYLAPGTRGYVYTSADGNGLLIPDENALDVTGDIDVRVLLAMDDWTPSLTAVLFSKWATNQSWWLQIETTGVLRWRWSTTGTDAITAIGTASVPAQDGEPIWLRVTHDVDNGASGNDVRFFTSLDGVTWTQLGSTVTTAGVTSIFSGAATVNVGGYFNHAAAVPSAKFYAAQMWNGIEGSGGTKVLDIDCNVITSGGAMSFAAVSGQTVTITRASTGRKTVAVPRTGQPVFLLATDDYLEVQDTWQHGLLNFDRGQSFTVVCVTRQWNNQPANARVLSKGFFGIGGYGVITTTTTNNFFAYDPVTNPNAASSTRANGAVAVSTGIYNRVTQNIAAYVGATAGTPVSLTNDAPSTTRPMTIGRESSAANYNDMEFYAAAVFRRALTASEVALLTSAFDYDAIGAPFDMQYLVIGGGGSGATVGNNTGSGGGGAGGYRCNVPGESSGGGATQEPALTLRRGIPYTLTVGAGGAARTLNGNIGLAGGNSVFASITSIGGGGGANTSASGGTGGSGGGAGVSSTSATSVGGGTFAQGFNGGTANFDATVANRSGGGGGGAGAVGGNGGVGIGGNGGNGIASSITGSSVTRAAGGGGNSPGATQGTGGTGGGGAAALNANAGNGTANTGSGGGALGQTTSGTYSSGAGGSGVVILKYPDSITATFSSGVTQTTTTSGGFSVTTVTATSTTTETVIFS